MSPSHADEIQPPAWSTSSTSPAPPTSSTSHIWSTSPAIRKPETFQMRRNSLQDLKPTCHTHLRESPGVEAFFIRKSNWARGWTDTQHQNHNPSVFHLDTSSVYNVHANKASLSSVASDDRIKYKHLDQWIKPCRLFNVAMLCERLDCRMLIFSVLMFFNVLFSPHLHVW